MHRLLLLVAATSAAGDEIVARVDGQPVLASEIATRIRPGRADAAEILSELLDEAVLAAEGERTGLSGDPAVLAEVAAHRRQLAAERLLATELRPNLRPSEAMLRSAYHSKSDFVRLALLVLPTHEKAEEAKARLQAGADFAVEARHSLDMRSAARGGDQGLQARAQLPAVLAEVAFSAPLGEVAGPIALDLGFALVRVSERIVGDEAGFLRDRAALGAFVERQLFSQGRAHLLEQFRREAGGDLDVDFFEKLGSRLDATEAEATHAIATVYGTPVRYGDVLPEIRRLARGTSGGHLSGPSVKVQVAREEVDRVVLEETALRRGHGDAPELAAALARHRRDALTRAVARRIRAAVPAATEADLEAERIRARELERPGRRACAHVLVETKDEAERARERVARGEPFAVVAAAVSRDASTASQGGHLGDITDPRLREIAKHEIGLARAIERARPGEPTRPASSRSGWHVLLCEARIPPGPPPLAEIREALAARIAKERGDDAVRRRMRELRSTARVEVDEAALARAVATPR